MLSAKASMPVVLASKMSLYHSVALYDATMPTCALGQQPGQALDGATYHEVGKDVARVGVRGEERE